MHAENGCYLIFSKKTLCQWSFKQPLKCSHAWGYGRDHTLSLKYRSKATMGWGSPITDKYDDIHIHWLDIITLESLPWSYVLLKTIIMIASQYNVHIYCTWVNMNCNSRHLASQGSASDHNACICYTLFCLCMKRCCWRACVYSTGLHLYYRTSCSWFLYSVNYYSLLQNLFVWRCKWVESLSGLPICNFAVTRYSYSDM